jgi:hypothetical protein
MLDVHRIKTVFAGTFVLHRYDPWESEVKLMYIVPQYYGPVMRGGVLWLEVFSIKKIIVDKCVNMEVWGEFSLSFSSEIWFRIYRNI